MSQPPIALTDFRGQYWNGARAFEETAHALSCLKQYLGHWYKWGGNTPDGFDCSGLACEYLKMLGIISRRSDFSAKSLTQILPVHRHTKDYLPGDLVFYGPSLDAIQHVEICVTRYMAIGASGGGSKTLSLQDAIRDSAFIKVRPIFGGRGGNPLQLFGNTQQALLKVFESGRPIA